MNPNTLAYLIYSVLAWVAMFTLCIVTGSAGALVLSTLGVGATYVFQAIAANGPITPVRQNYLRVFQFLICGMWLGALFLVADTL